MWEHSPFCLLSQPCLQHTATFDEPHLGLKLGHLNLCFTTSRAINVWMQIPATVPASRMGLGMSIANIVCDKDHMCVSHGPE